MKPILVVGGRQSEFAPIYKKKRLAQNFRLRRLETYNDGLYCGFISYKQNDDITDINRIQEYEVNAGVTLDVAASGGRWGRVGYCGKRGGGRRGFKRGVDWTWGGGGGG